MRVVIHVGAHKTGTSLVQRYFSDQPRKTRARGISLIPREDASHQLVGWGQFLHERPEALRNRLEEEAAKQPSVVLMSNENTLGRPFMPNRSGLYPNAAWCVDGLLKACDGFDPHIVFYVRPIADFLESYYLQTVQQGAWHSFEDWYATLDGPLAWTPALKALDDAFGAERVLVGDFAEITAGQNQFLQQFMTRAGIPQPPTVVYEPVRNPSLSARGLEIALAINPHLSSAGERRASRMFLQKNFSNQVEDRARPMPEDLRRAVQDETAAEFEVLAARAAAGLQTPPVISAAEPEPERSAAGRTRNRRTSFRRLAGRLRARSRR
jgi:hypothetical protein